MNKGFWNNLPRPFFALAPMYDVTDLAFRQTIIECGRPDVFFTEFTSSDGLASPGRERLMHHLLREKNERPIVAQIFGAHPEAFTTSAKLIADLGFDGVDINMGCPDKATMKQGSCAALFKNPKLAQKIILATKQGAGTLPVSVKIRIGDTNVDWENWILALLETEPSAFSIHLRTRKEMSKVPAHWEELSKIVTFINQHSNPENRPLIVGNGDITSISEAREKIALTGCDGIMIGRGVFQNPWIFNENIEAASITPETKARLLLNHADRFEQKFFGTKRFEVLKRFFKIYISGFPTAAQIREELYHTTSTSEARNVLIKHGLV